MAVGTTLKQLIPYINLYIEEKTKNPISFCLHWIYCDALSLGELKSYYYREVEKILDPLSAHHAGILYTSMYCICSPLVVTFIN